MKSAGSLKSLFDWYEERPLRERIMLLVCFVVVVLFIWDAVLMSSFDLRKNMAQDKIGQLRIELTELQTREQVVEIRKDFDPDEKERRLLEQLVRKEAANRQKLEENVDALISPREMPEMLRELLKSQQKLKLLSLENLPAEALAVGNQGGEEPIAPELYRHQLRLEFSGDYLSILAYLQMLEELPRRIAWQELEIETQEYPQAKVRLQVYTLSLEEGWIGG